MSKTKTPRNAAKKKNVVRPAVDTLTVGWITMLSTALMCEVGSAAARLYVSYFDKQARLLGYFADYLLLAAAAIGMLLLMVTPVVVKRKKSNPPLPLVLFAYFVGAVPWLVMLSRLTE